MLTIVSGAAPGVEQGAIEAAVNLALTWRGRASGEHIAALPAIYRTGLQPTSAANPGMVRRLNCQDADGALVFSTSMVLAGIPAFVDRVTEQMQRAFLHVTLNPAALSPLPVGVRDHIRDWISSNELGSVYVTGPSADDVPGIQGAVRDILIAILEPFAVDEIHETTRALGLIEQAQPGPPEPHPFVPGRFRQGDRGGQWPSETCDVCGTDPRNALHRAAAGPPEGLDDTQRARLDASIREAERDIRDEYTMPPPGGWRVEGDIGPPVPNAVADFIESLECCPRPPSLADIRRLWDAFYLLPGNGAGGSLHVVLDDGNWERECVEFCRKSAADRDDVPGQRFAELLLTLTDAQLREYLCPGYCGLCGADYGDKHARSEFVQQTFPPGPCPECGSEPAQPPAPGDQTT